MLVNGWVALSTQYRINQSIAWVGGYVDRLEYSVHIIIDTGANQQCRSPISALLLAQSCEAD
jgi:hypothetical protein